MGLFNTLSSPQSSNSLFTVSNFVFCLRLHVSSHISDPLSSPVTLKV